MDSLSPGHQSLLQDLLKDRLSLLPFAEAVVVHLSGPSVRLGPFEEVAFLVAGILKALLEGPSRGSRAALRENPEVLASFFQNADLLEYDTRDADAIGRAVMQAVAEGR